MRECVCVCVCACVCVCLHAHSCGTRRGMKFDRMIETDERMRGWEGAELQVESSSRFSADSADSSVCSGAFNLGRAWQTELRAAETRCFFWVPSGCRGDARLHKAHSWSQSRCSDQRITVIGRVWWRPVCLVMQLEPPRFLLRSDWSPSQQQHLRYATMKTFSANCAVGCYRGYHVIISILQFETYTVWAFILVNVGFYFEFHSSIPGSSLDRPMYPTKTTTRVGCESSCSQDLQI